MHTAGRFSLYDRLMSLPDNLVGEILDGRLHTQPRPSGPHARAETILGSELSDPFDRGKGGPGGWWILIEPEVHFIRDREVAVPDLAGWRRERMPQIPSGHRFEVTPDWVCEILSPATESKDRRIKMPLYARYGVPYLWLIDPERHSLEAYALQQGDWQPIVQHQRKVSVAVSPFDAVEIELGDLWV